MPYCRNCGTEITEQEDMDYNGRCINCLEPQPVVNFDHLDSPCYICGRPFHVKCDDCGKPLCSVHVQERSIGGSGSHRIKKRCPDCDKRKHQGNIIQVVVIAIVMIVFLVVLPILQR